MVIVSHSSLWGCLRWMSEVTPGIPWEKIGSICRKAAGYICSLGYRVKIRDGRIRQCPKWLVNLTHAQNLRLNFSFSLVNNFQVLAQPPHASLLLKSLIFFSTKLLVQSFNPSFSLCFFFLGGAGLAIHQPRALVFPGGRAAKVGLWRSKHLTGGGLLAASLRLFESNHLGHRRRVRLWVEMDEP